MSKNESILIVNKAREAAACAEANCASSFTNATNAATSAAAAAASAEIAGIYLGPKAVAPTTDNDGGPLQEGMLYFNTVSNVLFVWNGSAWVSADFNEFTNFTATGTTTARNLVTRFADVVNVKDFGAVGDGVTDDTAAWNNFLAASSGIKIIQAGSYKISGIVYTYPNLVFRDNVQLFPPNIVGTETRGFEFGVLQNLGAFRVGGSDNVPLNDENNFWRGLPSQNAWGNNSNIGAFSVAFNRNGASYKEYSTTFGHDCVTYGVASFASGAGSCTGDPDNPSSSNFEGYCSAAIGKNVLALGEKSVALNEETEARSRASLASGYDSIAGEYSGSGLGATALGAYSRAFGDGSFSAGKYIQSSYGGYTIGSGINPGSALNNQRVNTIAFGSNTISPAMYVNPGSGTTAPGDVGYAEFFSAPVRLTELLGGVTLFTCGQIRPLITNSGGNGYGAVQLEANINGTIVSVCRADSDTNIPSFLPTADNSRRLGSGTLRWEVIFAATGTINTSDERQKQQISHDLSPELKAWSKVEFCKFKYNDAVEQKGDKARIHFGLIAQKVKEAFESEGLNAFEYGLLCYDEWEEVEEKKDFEGNVIVSHIPKGNRYGIRYDEALALECAYQRSITKNLISRIESLESK